MLDYVERARARGAFTIAVTNEPGSARSRLRPTLVLPLAAGPEHAIAATKTYTNQIAALALLAGYAAGRGPESWTASAARRDLLDELLPALERRVWPSSRVSLAFVGRMFVIGRGPEFATAREISLKLLETCRVAAEPLTATDLIHGPVAALDGLFPVWTIASATRACPPCARRLRGRARRGRR